MEAADLLFTRRGEEAADSVWGLGLICLALTSPSALFIFISSLVLLFFLRLLFLGPSPPPASLTTTEVGYVPQPRGYFKVTDV